MSETYPIKIESVVLSKDFLTDLTNLFEKIYNKIKTQYSVIEYTIERKNGQINIFDSKEEFLQQRISKDLQRVELYFYENDKKIRVYIHRDYNSSIEITSNDQQWNRANANFFQEIIENYEKKFNKWVNRRGSKIILILIMIALLTIAYIILFSSVDPAFYLYIGFSMFTTYTLVGVFGPDIITYFYPKVEHPEMLRVKTRNYILFLIIPSIIAGLIVIVITIPFSIYFLIKSLLEYFKVV